MSNIKLDQIIQKTCEENHIKSDDWNIEWEILDKIEKNIYQEVKGIYPDYEVEVRMESTDGDILWEVDSMLKAMHGHTVVDSANDLFNEYYIFVTVYKK